MKTKAEVGVTRLQAKEGQPKKDHRTGPPSQFPEGTDAVNTLVLDSSLQNCETTHFYCLSIQFLVLCDGSPWEEAKYIRLENKLDIFLFHFSSRMKVKQMEMSAFRGCFHKLFCIKDT